LRRTHISNEVTHPLMLMYDLSEASAAAEGTRRGGDCSTGRVCITMLSGTVIALAVLGARGSGSIVSNGTRGRCNGGPLRAESGGMPDVVARH